MIRCVVVALIMAAVVSAVGCSPESPKGDVTARPVPAVSTGKHRGEELFRQYCASCHPDGGNVSDPNRGLSSSSLKARHLASTQAIVRVMRNPTSRMIRFDEATISNQDAQAIAEYVLNAFER